MKTGQPFHILIANFSEQNIHLLPHQVVGYGSQHPETIIESDITNEKMLRIIPDDVETEFRKRHRNARDIATINKYLADHREQNLGVYEKPLTAVDIYLDVLHEKEDKIRNILRKNEQIRSRQLEDI